MSKFVILGNKKNVIFINRQLNIYYVPLVSVINIEHDIVGLANRIDWASAEKKFSHFYFFVVRLFSNMTSNIVRASLYIFKLYSICRDAENFKPQNNFV
jgi:hypothetical protein